MALLNLDEIPDPDSYLPPDYPQENPGDSKSSGGFFGGLKRSFKGPNTVWVKNEHNGPIRVVVSGYRPRRILSSAGVEAAADGAGINFDTVQYEEPVTGKRLEYRDKKAFPLWDIWQDFAVITVFKGIEQVPCVENDRIAAFTTVIFENDDLSLYDEKMRPL